MAQEILQPSEKQAVQKWLHSWLLTTDRPKTEFPLRQIDLRGTELGATINMVVQVAFLFSPNAEQSISIAGSSLLYILGIIDKSGDVDVLVDPDIWEIWKRNAEFLPYTFTAEDSRIQYLPDSGNSFLGAEVFSFWDQPSVEYADLLEFPGRTTINLLLDGYNPHIRVQFCGLPFIILYKLLKNRDGLGGKDWAHLEALRKFLGYTDVEWNTLLQEFRARHAQYFSDTAEI